jgi:hypothetical protein
VKSGEVMSSIKRLCPDRIPLKSMEGTFRLFPSFGGDQSYCGDNEFGWCIVGGSKSLQMTARRGKYVAWVQVLGEKIHAAVCCSIEQKPYKL